MRNVSGTTRRENQNTLFMFSNFSKTFAIFEMIWKNMAE
jgi:hypothetical protein